MRPVVTQGCHLSQSAKEGMTYDCHRERYWLVWDHQLLLQATLGKKGIKRVHPLYSVGPLSSPIWWSQIADAHCLPWKATAQPCCAFGPQYYTALSLVHAKNVPQNHKHWLQSGVFQKLVCRGLIQFTSSKCYISV